MRTVQESVNGAGELAQEAIGKLRDPRHPEHRGEHKPSS